MAPSKQLPAWALEIMERWRNPPWPWVSIDDDLAHRRAAFYRLYTAGGVEVQAMWATLEARLAEDERSAFIHLAVLATDEIVQDEPLPVYSVEAAPAPRLRTRRQRLARKLAEQAQLLAACTPPRCRANQVVLCHVSVLVEMLVVFFGIGQVPRDYDLRWRLSRLSIEYTTSSKRGWVQHRRASDAVRQKAVETARQLAAEVAANNTVRAELASFILAMEQLPSMAEEHQGDLALASQKAGYLDWFRVAYRGSRHCSATAGVSPLSQAGWATLASLMADDPLIGPDDIAHAARACQIL